MAREPRDIGEWLDGPADSRAAAWGLLIVAGFLIAAIPPLMDVMAGASPPRWRIARDCADDIAGRARTSTPSPGVAALIARNRAVRAGLEACEARIDDAAPLRAALLAPVQSLLTLGFRSGNDQVHVGQHGWWYFRPALDHVTGRGFLTEAWQRARTQQTSPAASVVHADPRPAILSLQRSLVARGIHLLVLPTPGKASIVPALVGRPLARTTGPVRNASYQTFVASLRAAGVAVVDPGPALASFGRQAPAYLERDTHWTPDAMATVARMLADEARGRLGPPGTRITYGTERHDISAPGDLVALLGLSPAVVRPQTARITRVLTADGPPWQATRGARLLLLGDSFSNIYSSASLGWGTSAGLAEHLSLALAEPIDRMVQNDAGSQATRAMLGRAFSQDPDRLASTRLVIYQFAERELSYGDWRPVSGLE